MRTFRLFATLFVVALCTMAVTSCSNDDDDKKEETSIVGKWKLMESGHTNDVLEFKSNGNFTYYYTDNNYSEDGKYKIESGMLYMMWLEDDELDWEIWKINTLNSISLIIQVYENDGTLSDWTESYQRIN